MATFPEVSPQTAPEISSSPSHHFVRAELVEAFCLKDIRHISTAAQSIVAILSSRAAMLAHAKDG